MSIVHHQPDCPGRSALRLSGRIDVTEATRWASRLRARLPGGRGGREGRPTLLLKVSAYNQNVTIMGELSTLQDRLYESDVSQYSGWAPSDAVRVICC